MAMLSDGKRVEQRRRIAVRVGGVVLVALSAAACIFDSGSGYQGGGRRDTPTAKPSDEGTADPTSTTTTAPPSDAGAGG